MVKVRVPQFRSKQLRDQDERLGRVFIDAESDYLIYSYTDAYHQSAKQLFDTAKRDNKLRHFVGPIAFLLRHTLELVLKRVIADCYGLIELHKDIAGAATEWRVPPEPDAEARRRLAKSHNLKELLDDMKKAMSDLGLQATWAPFEHAVDIFAAAEGGNDTFWRYELDSKGRVVFHRDVDLPLAELVTIIDDVTYLMHESSDEALLYNLLLEEWQKLDSTLANIEGAAEFNEP
jgi:hypothetical protein